MRPIDFQQANCVYAANQPEYLPLPALKDGGPGEQVTSCWRLTWRERIRLLLTGKLWLAVWTFGQPLQPILHGTTPEEVGASVRQ